ncbi:unannotated protein [freshwater metagenome]|uniref:Unannotated protein n=1 Tax=freshwater metagenome TaxID=449393 RepID=A0A6J7BU45_9ZZZZ
MQEPNSRQNKEIEPIRSTPAMNLGYLVDEVPTSTPPGSPAVGMLAPTAIHSSAHHRLLTQEPVDAEGKFSGL